MQKIVTGNAPDECSPLSPYRSGPDLVAFFNVLGEDDTYQWGGAPSRWAYAEDRLRAMNGTDRIIPAIEAAVDPAHFLGTPQDVGEAVAYLNKYLEYEGYQLVRHGKACRLRWNNEALVALETPLDPSRHVNHEFIAEQIEKCDMKLRGEDYDGAITNSRSMNEAVLSDIEARLDPSPPKYDGEVIALYKRVQKLLNLDPARPDIESSLRQILVGLMNIVGGLAPLRNKMGDAHVRKYKPARHHAKLAVNAAKTLADFVYDTFEYQLSAGTIVEVRTSKPR